MISGWLLYKSKVKKAKKEMGRGGENLGFLGERELNSTSLESHSKTPSTEACASSVHGSREAVGAWQSGVWCAFLGRL